MDLAEISSPSTVKMGLDGTTALTPAQWLPKPATNWLPSKSFTLRALWSPEERESFVTRSGHSDVVVAVAAGWLAESKRRGAASVQDLAEVWSGRG